MSDSKKKFLQLQKERIKNSANYKNGRFQNLEATEVMSFGSFPKIIKAFANKPADLRPPSRLPTVTLDLNGIPADKTTLVWFGHSSYFLQVDKIKILVDPVFSGHASPLPFMIKGFDGTDSIQANDLPDLDVVVLTHDHYDHLDYALVKTIGNRVGQFICSLGVGKHLVNWGIDTSKITELDWWEGTKTLGLTFTAVPARHFSGRGIRRMKSLWSAFVLETATHTFFLGGDSGYGEHFKTIAKQFNGFDMAMLEAGQYNELWHTIHMMPEETVKAALELGAKSLLPVHWGKFSLAIHGWTEPIERVITAAKKNNLRVCTPMIGEKVFLDQQLPDHTWWRAIN